MSESQVPSAAVVPGAHWPGAVLAALVAGLWVLAPVRLQAHESTPLAFEVNRGQADPQVDFLSHGPGYLLAISPAALALGLMPDARPPGHSRSNLVRMRFVHANPHPTKAAIEKSAFKVNYFIGNDPTRWMSNVATYSKVRYQGIYPGVDLTYYGHQGQLEYDLEISPGTDPKTILLDFEAAAAPQIDTQGNLRLRTADAQLVQLNKPLIYQEVNGVRQKIAGGYRVRNRLVSFEIDAYDPSKALVIDPVVVYSTYLNGRNDGAAWAIAVDREGNAYVTGDTNSARFPLSKRPVQGTYAGETDVFISKLSADGSKLLYSTYLGGSGAEVGYGIALDPEGNIYVTGDTSSSDFPVVNPLQSTLKGAPDVFVAKLSADGATLLYSTYIGGSGGDRGNGIAVDASGNAYVTGYTHSVDFPTANPLQPAFGGGNADAFVLKLNPNGSALVYSTYLGGGNDRPDIGTAIAVDSTGSAYVAGFTNSKDFPTVRPLQPFVGPTDAFVAKLNPTGSALVYSTHLGGSADDEAMGIAVDADGSAYVTGETESPDFPTTPGAVSRSCVAVPAHSRIGDICSGGDAFLAKLAPDGSSLIYSTYINGTGFDVGRSVAVGKDGSAYVTGITASKDFPTVAPVQKSFGGGEFDAFVVKVNPGGSALMYSTYLGGSGDDGGYGIAVDIKDNAYVAGFTTSSDFPTRHALRSTPRKLPPGLRTPFITKISNTGDLPGLSSATASVPTMPELMGRIVAVGIPGISGVAAVGIFHPGGPVHDNPAFRASTEHDGILAPERIFVTSTSNFGASLGRKDQPPGSVLSIDPRGSEPILVPPAFAAKGDQASALDGRVMLFSANSPAFLNGVHNPTALTANLAPVSNPTALSLNNAFGRIWVTSVPFGLRGAGVHSILDPDGCPLDGAPNKTAGGIFTGAATNRQPQVAQGSMDSGTLATALLGKSPDGSGRAVFAGLHADGSLIQLNTEQGVDGLAPKGTIKSIEDGAHVTRAGIAFNWIPNPILYVTDPLENSVIALSLQADATVFRVQGIRRLTHALSLPVDIAPAVPEISSSIFSSNTTLAGDSDMYVVNRGDGTLVRLKQDGSVVAIRRVTLPGIGALGADRLNGIAVSPDSLRIWVTVSGTLRGYAEGALIELSSFGGPDNSPHG